MIRFRNLLYALMFAGLLLVTSSTTVAAAISRYGANHSNDYGGHKTCEIRRFWPDNCGNWQAT